MAVRINPFEDFYTEIGIICEKSFDKERAFFALDIGTTALAAALTDGISTAGVLTALNPQIIYGTDIIGRIKACAGGNGDRLHSVLIKKINGMLKALAEKHGISKIEKIVAGGNTVMLHILLGEDCTGMGYAPYTPVFLKSQRRSAASLGLDFDCMLETVPCISAFAGGDIVSCIAACGMPPDGCKNIIIDLGTNAEIAVYDAGGGTVATAAAGPCFEGAEISCGMPASNGALYSFSMKNGIKKALVIGNAAPEGICGTGLIDIVAEMLKNGYIDKTGLMQSGSFEVDRGISIIQDDIRAFQLAKAAVRAATEILLNLNGGHEKIYKIYIAGGFSAYFSAENAAVCGLIPEKLKHKCETAGNGSLKGTIICGLDKTLHEKIAAGMKCVDLSCGDDFSEKFIRYIDF